MIKLYDWVEIVKLDEADLEETNLKVGDIGIVTVVDNGDGENETSYHVDFENAKTPFGTVGILYESQVKLVHEYKEGEVNLGDTVEITALEELDELILKGLGIGDRGVVKFISPDKEQAVVEFDKDFTVKGILGSILLDGDYVFYLNQLKVVESLVDSYKISVGDKVTITQTEDTDEVIFGVEMGMTGVIVAIEENSPFIQVDIENGVNGYYLGRYQIEKIED